MKNSSLGPHYVISAYVIFGLLPLYWRLLSEVPPETILIHRILWTAVSLGAALLVTGKLGAALKHLQNPKTLTIIFSSASLLSINWLAYLWAVTHEQVVGASMGYFMSPVVSVLLGTIVLGERLTARKKVALMLIVTGLLARTYLLESIPWVALVLCVTFSFYTLLHKLPKLPALEGLFLETCIMLFASTALCSFQEQSEIWQQTSTANTLLVLSGAATALPLALLIIGTKQVSLQFVGIAQYLIPTLYFALAVFVFGESIEASEVLSFFLIWIGILSFCTHPPKWTPGRLFTAVNSSGARLEKLVRQGSNLLE